MKLPSKGSIISKSVFVPDERDPMYLNCSVGTKLVIKMERSTFLFEGTLNSDLMVGQEISKEQIFASVFSLSNDIGSVYVQALPDGFTPGEAEARSNSSSKYGEQFFPPKYCIPTEFRAWSIVCQPSITSAHTSYLDCQRGKSLELRYSYFARVQEHYFRSPPIIERGYKSFLYDVFGRAYLDMVNNVAVVGHSHPAVTAAAVNQLQILNTNSRFIYSALGRFCEKIISKLPQHLVQQGKLNKVFLVNSGSEATDLAMRLARSVVTERRRKELLLAGVDPGKYSLNRDSICL